jgi:ketosteroid isomerase-like protein
MERLHERLRQFIDLVESGKPIEAMRRFYAEDILVFENRELARAGRDACIAYEQQQLDAQPTPPRLRATKWAANPQSGACFIEWVVRFESQAKRPLRLEEVAVQQWSDTGIEEERFYYHGFVDEGDEEEEAEPATSPD